MGVLTDELIRSSARNTAPIVTMVTNSFVKNPDGRRRVVRRQAAHTGTGRLNVDFDPPTRKKRVTRVSCISFVQSAAPQLQQNGAGKFSAGAVTSMIISSSA